MKSKKSSNNRSSTNKTKAPELFAAPDARLISELSLSNFGKFKDRRFDLGATTIFFGPNEAGKTTIFEALFAALCQPRANRTDGKRLRERYGENARAFFGPDSAQSRLPQISEEEFMNLYAVRAGDIRVEITSHASWMDRVKSRLFSGDLDPAVVARNLEVLASDDGKRVHNKEIKKLRDDLVRLERELEQKNSEQQTLRMREKEIDRVNATLEKTRGEIVELREQLAQTELELAREERIRERDALNRRLRILKEAERAEHRARELEQYAEDHLPELDGLETDNRRLHEQVLACDARVAHQAEALEQARANLHALEASEPLARRKSDEADHCLDRMQRTATNSYLKTKIRWQPARLIAAAVTAGLGVIVTTIATVAFPTVSPALAFLPLALALCLAGGLAWSARSVVQVADESARRGLLDTFKDDWRSRIGEEFPAVHSLDAASEALTRFRLQYESLQKQIETETERVRELKATLHATQSEREAAIDRQRAKALELTAWLKQNGVADRAGYALKREDRRRALEEHAKIADEIEQIVRQGGLADADALQIECERRLKALDADGVPATGRSETEFRELQNQIARQRLRLDQLNQNERELGEKRAGDSGELRGALQRLTAEVGSLEQSRLRLRAEISGREIDKEAAGVALKIFEELRSDNNVLLEQLLGELGQSVRKILPGVESLGMQTNGDFIMQELLIPDAGGTERRMEHLSSGTRDSFVFAARIALAGHSRDADDPAILILDEPFLTLDEPRERQCLEFLREFQQERGWQLVLLTKEERLRNSAREVFTESVVLHELERARLA